MKTRRKRIRIGRKRRRAGTKRKRDPPTPRREPRRRLNPQPQQQQQQQQQPQGELNIDNDDYDEHEDLAEYIAENVDPDEPFEGGKRRKKKTRKKRGGLDSFPIGMLDQLSQDTVYNNPYKDDLIRRLNHIWNILGEDEEDDEDAQEAFKDLIRRNPKSFYPLIIHFIQTAEAEHHGGRRKKKKTRKKRGGEGLKDLSVEELKAALDRSLSFHIHLFGQLVDASGEFNYKFRHPNWGQDHSSVEEQLFGKYEDWRYDQMMEHKGIAADYGDEMGQYIANAPIDELNGTMDFYCENWKSALGERLKNSILNFKKKNKEKIQEINFEHFFEWEKLVKKSKSLEKLYLEFIDRIKEIYEEYQKKKKMKDVEERQEKKETDDDEYGTFDVGAREGDPEYDEALDKYRKYYKGEDIKPMMKAYFDNNGFGWDGVAPNEILGHNDYKKALIDITKHTKDNIDEEFNYHYFDGEWVEITTEESIKPIVWVIENTQNNINRFASSNLPEDRNGLDEMIKTMRDGEMTGGFWIVEWNKEREKDDRYNHFHLAWSDYDTEPLNVIRFVEMHGPLHSSEVESTDVESLGSNPEGPIGGQGPTSGGKRKRKTSDYTGKVIRVNFNKVKMQNIILGTYPDNVEILEYFVEGEDDGVLYLQDYPFREYKDLRLPLSAVKADLVTIEIVKDLLSDDKRTRKKRGGAHKFLCGPDIDFVPEVHFNELESIFNKLKEDTTDTALKEIVDELPSIRRDKKSGKCIGCKKLIDELVKNTMPSFVGPKILPIESDKILWLQQFTGVHKGGMCAVMGGRRKKKTRKKRGGMKKRIDELRKRINKSAKKIDKNRQNLSNPEIRTSQLTLLPFDRPMTESQTNFENAINRPISPIVSQDRKGGKRKKKTRKKRAGHHEPLLLAVVAASKLIKNKKRKKYKKRRTKKKSRKHKRRK